MWTLSLVIFFIEVMFVYCYIIYEEHVFYFKCRACKIDHVNKEMGFDYLSAYAIIFRWYVFRMSDVPCIHIFSLISPGNVWYPTSTIECVYWCGTGINHEHSRSMCENNLVISHIGWRNIYFQDIIGRMIPAIKGQEMSRIENKITISAGI